ncbi:MAG: OmpA family protein [Flavobacteriaceae bacterium]|nr:OmpA family protein [Flavobacteriaceae bacterium]
MKKIILYALLGVFLQAPVTAEAQILKKLKRKVERKVEKEVDKSIDNKEKKNEQKTDTVPIKKPDKDQKATKEQTPKNEQKPILEWAKYDFVPGDKVIFEDNQENEENGEFPSRWDLVRGTTENAQYGGENIIMFRGGSPKIIPYLKNPDKDYLPEVFTVEFDLYLNNPNSFQVYFWDEKNQKRSSESKALDIRYNGLNLSPASSRIPNSETIKDQWAHISIAYTNGKMKAYINETRLINIPHLSFDPTGITIYVYSASDQNIFYIKNFRIAEGGVKYYDRVLQDGKIIANGIRFDTGKATLKPESMGIINEIVQLMQEHSELKFSVEGHTDSDGNDASNLALSEERANTVKNTMVKLGISTDRLSTKGYGESMPMDTNNTPEGKANNRRVEFVKINEQ